VQDPADAFKDSPDQSEKTQQCGTDTQMRERQIFSSMRAALPDRSRR
jgi:hypothetical protein